MYTIDFSDTETSLPIARKVLELVDLGLCKGVGEPVPGKMCVEAAICFAMGLPHGDKPSCVEPAVRMFKIALNDKSWSSDAARAKGMRECAIAQLGSQGVVSGLVFLKRLAKLTIREIVPIALRAAAKWQEDPKPLNDAADRCEAEGTQDSARAAQKIAAAFAAADAAYAAAAADDDAAYAAERDRILSLSASLCVRVLRELKSPGVALMDMLIAKEPQ